MIFLICLGFALPYQRQVMRRDYEYSGTAEEMSTMAETVMTEARSAPVPSAR